MFSDGPIDGDDEDDDDDGAGRPPASSHPQSDEARKASILRLLRKAGLTPVGGGADMSLQEAEAFLRQLRREHARAGRGGHACVLREGRPAASCWRGGKEGGSVCVCGGECCCCCRQVCYLHGGPSVVGGSDRR